MTIDPKFRIRLQDEPSAQVGVIVTTNEPASQVVARAQALGLTVHRQYELQPMLALRGLASQVLELLDDPVIESVEEDRRITTMVDV